MIKDFSIFLVPEKRYTRKRFSAYFVMDLFLPKWFSPLNEINLYGCSHQTMSSTNSRGRYGVISIFWRTNKPVALTIINLLMRESTIHHLLYHIYVVDIYIALRVMLVYQKETHDITILEEYPYSKFLVILWSKWDNDFLIWYLAIRYLLQIYYIDVWFFDIDRITWSILSHIAIKGFSDIGANVHIGGTTLALRKMT